MALLWLEGFEGFSNTNLEAHLIRKYPDATTSTIFSESIVSGRYGGNALKGGSSAGDLNLRCPQFTAQQVIVAGAAFFIPDTVTSANPLLEFRIGSTVHCGVWVSTTKEIEFRRANTLVGSSGVRIKASRWFYIEMKVTISNTVGAYEIRLDGNTILSASGLDTANSATESCDNVALNLGNMNSNDFIWSADDWYVCNTLGTKNNDFLGDRRVVLLSPVSNDSVQFTPSTGQNYAAVDETPANDDTDYVESSTVGHKDTYNHAGTSELTDINGVMVQAVAKIPSGAETLKLIAKSNGVSDTSAGKTLSTSYEHEVHIVELNPDGSVDWTQTTLNAMKIGVEVG